LLVVFGFLPAELYCGRETDRRCSSVLLVVFGFLPAALYCCLQAWASRRVAVPPVGHKAHNLPRSARLPGIPLIPTAQVIQSPNPCIL
jgi:hypothetical protein